MATSTVALNSPMANGEAVVPFPAESVVLATLPGPALLGALLGTATSTVEAEPFWNGHTMTLPTVELLVHDGRAVAPIAVRSRKTWVLCVLIGAPTSPNLSIMAASLTSATPPM